ncbi:MAG: hypothetical protein IKY82_07100 [Alistipes sp.]|nr:hypothetical protein [Alistipes sp.]
MANNRTAKGYDSIIYYRRWAECLRHFPDDLRLAIHDAIDAYIIDQAEPTEDIVRFSAFAQIVEDIKLDKERYASTCEKRAEAGRKGAKSKHNISSK